MWTKELLEFQNELMSDVVSLRDAEEEGISTEDSFMSYTLDLLSEAGETENALVSREIREDAIGRRIHKINGYAASENFETLDLFVTVLHRSNEVQTLQKSEFQSAFSQCSAYFKAARLGYHREMEESSPAYDLTKWIDKYFKKIVRINLFLVTNHVVKHDAPASGKDENGIHFNYHVWDLERFHRLWTSANRREPITIDFNQYGGAVPCLESSSDNEDYECFLAIIPGNTLANIYESHGARLLEQNVRTFLQFTGKVNKGIRNTIRNEPHMFLPYNNGISCTALRVEREKDGTRISKAIDFQIVNGAQTTASIYHTHRQSKVPLDDIAVQMKLTVIKKEDEFAKRVSEISLFANSQNRITGSDITSNHPFHIRLEELSRNIWTPDPIKGKGTRWFFERARGQYRDSQSRELTRARRKAFETKNPSKQRFQKEDIAKYVHAWEKRPWEVVRGRQKNYALFMRELGKVKVDLLQPRYFHDLIGKAILFKTAERLYGVGRKSIGDIRFIVVPYTIAVLSDISSGRLNFDRIWKNQSLSGELEGTLMQLLRAVNSAIKDLASQGLVSEWAKKEESWAKLSLLKWKQTYEVKGIDVWTKSEYERRYDDSEASLEQLKRKEDILLIKGLPHQVWSLIAERGKSTGILEHWHLTLAYNIASRVREGKKLMDVEVEQGPVILELARQNYPDVFEHDFRDQTKSTEDFLIITDELIEEVLEWDKKAAKLYHKQFDYLKRRKNRASALREFEKEKMTSIIRTAMRYGFRRSR